MDIDKHNKEMEMLMKMAQEAKDNPGIDTSKLKIEGFAMVKSQYEVAKDFPWNKFFKLVNFVNDNIDNTEEKKIIAKVARDRKKILAMAEGFPAYFDSEKRCLVFLASYPKGFTLSESEAFVRLLIDSEYVTESDEIWKVNVFNDALYEVKECMTLEFDIPIPDTVSPFYFDKFDQNRLHDTHNFQKIVDHVGPMTIEDVNLVLFLIRAYSVETWDIPVGFDDVVINGIKETGYTFNEYDNGPDAFIECCEDIGLYKLTEFLKTRREERLIPLPA